MLRGDNDLDLVLGGTTIVQPIRATHLYFNETPISSGFSKEEVKEELILYPSPTNGQLSISGLTSFPTNIELYDINGKLVFTKQIMRNNELMKLSLRKGSYFEKVFNPDFLDTQTIIIQ